MYFCYADDISGAMSLYLEMKTFVEVIPLGER